MGISHRVSTDMPLQPCQVSTLGSLLQALTSLPPPGAPTIPAGLTCALGCCLPHKLGHLTPSRAGKGSTRPSGHHIITCVPSNHHSPRLITAGWYHQAAMVYGPSSELTSPTDSLGLHQAPCSLAACSTSLRGPQGESPASCLRKFPGPRTQPFFALSS